MPVLGMTSTHKSGMVSGAAGGVDDDADDDGKIGGFGGTILKNDPVLAGAIEFYEEIIQTLAKAKVEWWKVNDEDEDEDEEEEEDVC